MKYITDYTTWGSFFLEENVSIGFRLGTTITKSGWGYRITPQEFLSILNSVTYVFYRGKEFQAKSYK